jgi:transcriptional regulator with XRE-family HTH domain
VINNRDEKIITAFGKHLRKLRKEKDLSQEELNFRAELSKNMVGMIERGEINPTLSTIVLLAKGLEIPKKRLLEY